MRPRIPTIAEWLHLNVLPKIESIFIHSSFLYLLGVIGFLADASRTSQRIGFRLDSLRQVREKNQANPCSCIFFLRLSGRMSVQTSLI